MVEDSKLSLRASHFVLYQGRNDLVLGALLQSVLIILDELPDSAGREFMHNTKVLPWVIQVQGFVRDWFERLSV